MAKGEPYDARTLKHVVRRLRIDRAHRLHCARRSTIDYYRTRHDAVACALLLLIAKFETEREQATKKKRKGAGAKP